MGLPGFKNPAPGTLQIRNMENLRFRLHFLDRSILTFSQNKQGLNRIWLLLKPDHKTIADLASYLTRLFHLNDSCPNGILLSIDGFVLPQFESTSIVKDRDLICVRRKKGGVRDVVEHGDVSNFAEEEGNVHRRHLCTKNKLSLPNEEFEKEIGGCQSEDEEVGMEELSDEAFLGEIRKPESKKRAAHRKLKSPKRKKKKCTLEIPKSTDKGVENDTHLKKKRIAEICNSYVKDVDDHQQLEKNMCSQLSFKTRKALPTKDMPCNGGSTPNKMNNSESLTRSESNSESVQRENGNSKPKDNERCSPDTSQLPDDGKKGPSRSARRKKAKRRWLREKSKAEKEGQLKQNHSMVEKDHQESSEESSDEAVVKDEGPTITNDQQQDGDGVDDEVVPIQIRPGHIRFEPRSKDHDVLQIQHPEERLQWNGITSKKKGQKWGTEKGTNRSWNNDNHHNQETCIMMSSKDEIPERCILEFEKLEPYVGLPKKGDVLAYRLMELSSSWCPEVSSFRVGKISSYDPDSNVIRLDSVPEYPFTIESNQDEEEDGALESDTSPYNEDGSLEVEFSSIVDPRVVKWAILVASEVAIPKTIAAAENKVPALNNGLPKTQENITLTPANGAAVNTWDEVIQVLSAKKLELSAKESGLEKKQNLGKSSSSYRAMRGSALGPLMARLREQNELEGKEAWEEKHFDA